MRFKRRIPFFNSYNKSFSYFLPDKPSLAVGVSLAKRRHSETGYTGSNEPVFIIKCVIDASPVEFYNLTVEGKYIFQSNLNSYFSQYNLTCQPCK